MDELAALPAVEITRSTPPDEFRQRVVYQMQQLAGHDIRRLQDAINAAYLSAGWQRGRDATAAEDRRARAQALAWGFYLKSFLARGRDLPFAMDDLADGPLAEPATEAPRQQLWRRAAWRPLQATAAAAALAPPPTTAPEPQRGTVDLAQKALRLDAELGALEHTVGAINEQLARNERWIRSQGQRAPAAREAAQRLVKSAEQAIGATEATLLQQTQRLRP
ncbi:MAG: hypothetical protein IPL40_00085 [Proteobacteria bacterium]|nr:hypothetical protein [Pseudomonadota bacterium]